MRGLDNVTDQQWGWIDDGPLYLGTKQKKGWLEEKKNKIEKWNQRRAKKAEFDAVIYEEDEL